ncbi:hypothetical protein C8J56DRAFT_883526 [Mycena floridula]|nr:hypothetical protein C8J56DRAFT_883526 [Mycena floridula]
MALTCSSGNYMPLFSVTQKGNFEFTIDGTSITYTVTAMGMYSFVKASKSVYADIPVAVVPLSFGAFGAFFNSQPNVPRKFAIFDMSDRSMVIADKPSVEMSDFFSEDHPLIRYPRLGLQFRVPPSEAMPAELHLGSGATAFQQSMYSRLILSKAKEAVFREEKVSAHVAERKAKRRRRDWEDQDEDDSKEPVTEKQVVESSVEKKVSGKGKKKGAKKTGTPVLDTEMGDATV